MTGRRTERWVDAAAEVLNATAAQRAEEALAAALLEEFDAVLVVRASVRHDGASLRHWPAAWAAAAPAWVDGATTSHRPAPALRRTVSGPGLSGPQLVLPVGGDDRGYDAYAVARASRFDDSAVHRAQHLIPLLVGLDRHVRVLARLAPGTAPRPGPAAPSGAVVLTPRERTVLTGIIAGGTVAGIAARLGISPRTVHKHQQNLYRKLGAVDRLSAVLAAQHLGLIPVAGARAGTNGLTHAAPDRAPTARGR